MAVEQSTVEVNVLTKGLTEATASAQKLHDIMKATSNLAANIRIPTAVQAAQQQVAATNPRRAPVMAAADPEGGGGNTYGTARGTVGTGAAGRDFAKQAQGLGGLVHVYATFAANLFAVTAAFSALSKAADTTNIIKGLDQLGAQSGRSLGGVAKAMVEVTGGALSLREAMTSTALASSAGMTNAAMIRMTEVAKKASLALGRDMGDSMDRLTKGIAKVQPELLDELGIMARVIPAQEKYARELGKSVSALTDFEKKQAFANAVLEEGERKFSSINIDTNPYTQLSASLANVAQTGLELVNTVLGPLASTLAKSPTALGLALTGIAGILLKQAIPALGQYRKGLEEIRAMSLSKVAKLSEVVGESGTYDAIVGQRAKEKFLQESNYAEQTYSVKRKLAKQAAQIEEDAAEASIKRGQGLLGHETATNRIRDRLYADAAVAGAKYNVSQVQGAYGMRAAFSELRIEINKLREGTSKIEVGGKLVGDIPKIGAFRAALIGLTGTVAILGTAIGTLINAFAPWILAITAVASGIAFLIDNFRTTKKEIEALDRAFEGVQGAVKTAGDALDVINNKPFLEQISNASIQAKAAALNELSSSLGQLSNKAGLALTKLGKGGLSDEFNDARLVDGTAKFISSIFSGAKVSAADRSNLAKQMTEGAEESILAASKLVAGGNAEKVFKDQLKNVLGITYKDTEDLEIQLSKMPDTLFTKLPKLNKALEATNRALNQNASAAKELDDAWTAATKSYDNIMTSLAITDPLGKLGDETVKVGIAMTKAFEDPNNRLAELSKTATEFSRLRLLSPETQREMLVYSKGLEESAKKVEKLKERLKAYTAIEDKAKTEGPKTNMFGVASQASVKKNQDIIDLAQTNAKNIRQQIDAEAIKNDNQKLYLKAQDEMFSSGAKKVEVSIAQAFAKAAVTLSQTLVANTGNTKEGLQRQAELQKQSIDVESASLNAMIALATATNDLAKIQEEFNIALKTRELKSDLESKKISQGEYDIQRREVDKRAVALSRSREVKSFKDTTTDLQDKDPTVRLAAQQNYPLVAAKASADAQRALNDAKKKGFDIDAKSKEILLNTDAQKTKLDLENKRLSLSQAQLGVISQNAAYESSQLLVAKQAVEEQTTLNNQRKEELSIQGQIKVEEERLKLAKDPKDRKALIASIAKFQLDLSQKQDMFDKDKQVRETKYVQERKANQIAEFNYLKEFQVLNNTINTESLSAIQSTSSLYLDFVQQQKASIELSNLKLNFDKQANAEMQNQIILQDQLNKLKADPKADPRVVLAAQEALGQSTARYAQLEMKYDSDVRNANIRNQKLRLDGLETIRKKQADLAFAEIDTANKIAIIKLDAEDKLIQAKLSLGRISETTAAKLTAQNAQTRFQKEMETQLAAEKKLQDEEAVAKQNRQTELNNGLNAINADYENKRVELARQAQQKIDALKSKPIAVAGQNIPGAITRDVFESGVAQVARDQIVGAAGLDTQQLSDQAELKAKIALADTAANDAANQRLGTQNATNAAKAQELQYTILISEQQAKLNQLSKDQAFYTEMADSAAKSFAAGLTDAGKAMGDVIKLFAESATATEKYNIERMNAEKAVADTAGKSAEDQARDIKNLGQLDARYYTSRIDNFASIAGASANLFDKNSEQYQKLQALEKIIHLAKLSYMAIEQLRWLKNWAMRMLDSKKELVSSTLGSGLQLGKDAIGLGGKLLGGMGGNTDPVAGAVNYGLGGMVKSGMGLQAPANALAPSLGSSLLGSAAPAAGGAAAGGAGGIMGMLGGAGAALTAALPWVAGGIALLSLFGGKDKPKGPTPEELASVSGTGMRYNAAGKLEASGTGALGDASAANEGIAKSIDYLSKINYENLQFDKNKSLVALEAIRDNTENFVKSIGATGKIGDLTAGGTQLGKSSSFLGFGSKSTELAASGVRISGTIGDIADGLGGSVKKFEDIRRTSSSWWGLSSSTSVTRTENDVSEAARGFIKTTVGNFRTAIQESASSFGQDGGLLKPIIDQLDISFTAYQTGETSADFAKRVQEELGNKLDTAVKTVFPGIEGLASKFQNFGETLAEFAMRVQGDAEQIKFAFQSIGQGYSDSSTSGTPAGAMAQREAEQSLISGFGGASELFSAIDKYGNSMLSEAERLAPVRDNVNKKLVELFPALSAGGKSLITTREQFDNLRKSIDPLDPATQETWMALTKLGPAFASVTEAAIKLTDIELKKAKQDQYSAILNLKGDDLSKAKALAITRQRELDGMDALLKPTQMYIYALQDEAAAKDKLQNSYDKVKSAIGGTIDSLKSQTNALQDYKKNLQTGDKSNLTPQEAYAVSKGQLESTAAMAQTVLGDSASKEDIAARDKAVASLPSLMDQFLSQSKTSFASGDQYQADYSWVNSLLDSTTATLELQETDAQKQLDALNNSVSYLTNIDDSSKTTANLMADFLANQSSYEDAAASVASLQSATLEGILASLTDRVSLPGFAKGGLAGAGMAIVGEQGPELVDFASPGRVYTAGQTASFGDNTALVAELKALKDELSQLRSEQKEQTGHIIQSNYDANNRNAQVLSSVTENAIKQQTWKERSQVVIA